MSEVFDDRVEYAIQNIWVNFRSGNGEQAMRGLQEAAQEGNGDACYFLARCYSGPCYVDPGFGFESDDDKAEEWYNKSIELGSAVGMMGAMRVGGFKPRCGILNPDSASGVIEREVDTISTRPFDPFYLSDEGKQVYLNDVKDYWKNKCVLDRWNLMLPDDVKRLRANGAIFIDRKAVRGYGETTVDWRMIVNKGIGALKKEAEEALAKLDDAAPGDLEKSFFYKSEIMVADAIIHLSHRHADLAEKMASECADETRKAELLKIAEVCRWVPEHPARNFYEACQSILTYEYACYMEQNASSYNLGRLDRKSVV